MSIKPGVRVLGVRPEIVLALAILQDVFAKAGVPFVITSIMEGTHSRASLHYTGCAADLRRPPDTARATELVGLAKAALGDDFDVLLESDHFHLEWQPKAPY